MRIDHVEGDNQGTKRQQEHEKKDNGDDKIVLMTKARMKIWIVLINVGGIKWGCTRRSGQTDRSESRMIEMKKEAGE